jgi:hypothetical protein
VPVFETVDELRWAGLRPEFSSVCQRLGSSTLFDRVNRVNSKLTG